MSDINLKAYTCRAKELETAIYTQKQLMQRHEIILEEKRPKKPTRVKLNAPKKPQRSQYHIETQETTDNFTIGCMVAATILGLVLSFNIPILGVPLMLICGVGLLILLSQNFSANNNADKKNQELALQYQKDMSTYENKLKSYQKAQAELEINYKDKYAHYRQEVDRYDENTNLLMERHSSALSTLEAALNNLYNEDVIFPKYRNLIAITTINEYLESGRCSTLEGPNGAYNLYESETRQNIIIHQLSTVISNLEQIQNNQYALYTELTRANNQVEEIIHELRVLNNTALLNTYFNGITAIAEISPKIYYGVSF